MYLEVGVIVHLGDMGLLQDRLCLVSSLVHEEDISIISELNNKLISFYEKDIVYLYWPRIDYRMRQWTE